MTDMNHLKREYLKHTLSRNDLDTNPFDQFRFWLDEAVKEKIIEPNAMILATANETGRPSTRTVLLKKVTDTSFFFYTNENSRKGRELAQNPRVSATFLWKESERQVHIEGNVIKSSREDAAIYFKRRFRDSQISSWASQQDEVIASRAELEGSFERYEKEFEGAEVPAPPYWTGYEIIISRFEFWQGRANRLHDRFVYELRNDTWNIKRLSP